MIVPDFFLSCDWGTSAFRLQLVATDSQQVIAAFQSSDGVQSVATKTGSDAFQQTVANAIDCLSDWPAKGGVPLIISGMASSSIGWRELPYARLPFPVDGRSAVVTEEPGFSTANGRLVSKVGLISGLQSDVDVMRGEETQVIGFLNHPDGQHLSDCGIIILPGTHSKHAWIQADEIVSFNTAMTGEMFDLLSNHSILHHSLSSAEGSAAAFADGIHAGSQLPFLSALFRVRTRTLLDGTSKDDNREYLSGLLLGNELAALGELDAPLAILGSEQLVKRYRRALGFLGMAGRVTFAGAADHLASAHWAIWTQHCRNGAQ